MNLMLETSRLLLRSPEVTDVAQIVPLLGNFEVVRNLGLVPHPYTERNGHWWVSDTAAKRARGEEYAFSVVNKKTLAYLGCCTVHSSVDFELGYWLGKPYWGEGYATEAARRVARFAFEDLHAEKLTSGYMHDNPGSGRVLAKLGFVYSHDEMRGCLSRNEEVLQHRVVVTHEAFISANVSS